jgi:hypothetical protein
MQTKKQQEVMVEQKTNEFWKKKEKQKIKLSIRDRERS